MITKHPFNLHKSLPNLEWKEDKEKEESTLQILQKEKYRTKNGSWIIETTETWQKHLKYQRDNFS